MAGILPPARRPRGRLGEESDFCRCQWVWVRLFYRVQHQVGPEQRGRCRDQMGLADRADREGDGSTRLPRPVAVPAADAGEPAASRSLLVLVAELESAVERVSALDPSEVEGTTAAELSVRLHRGIDRLRAVQLGLLGRVESDAAWVGTGARSLTSWVARCHDVAYREAQRWVRSARVWRDSLAATGA